jgi:hypothetical protein
LIHSPASRNHASFEWVYRPLGLLAAFVGLRAKPRDILIGHAI